MARRLPPLNALRAFEAVARLRSFKAAAEELSVTQSAVSHQVRALEEWAGLELFRREGRGVALTDPAQSYLTALSPALDTIDSATRRLLMSDPRKGWLTVATMPSFAAKWLLPRLAQFRARHPEIDVWLSTWEDLDTFANGEADVAIRYGEGDWPDVHATRFMTETLFPVCSPVLMAGAHPLKTPEDLKHHTLLHDELPENWGMWLEAAGVSDIDAERGPGFDDSSLLIQAAIGGMGVALGRSALVKADLEAGLLVKPFDLMLEATGAYYVVSREGTETLPKIAAFRDWLIEEARRT
ncbi:MAG: transcriptional regulator GcvA [Alphaproteobacteria bacterium]|nr:transcriptional regulator GcvA [Alphaproteobacteria bacterium]